MDRDALPGHRRGVGCDCLGLVRGIWAALYGRLPQEPGPYCADWAEAGGRDRLLDAARLHFKEVGVDQALPGDLLLFRWRPHLPAKHLGILSGPDRFIHAYSGHGVMVSPLVPQWRRRITAAFAFPEPQAY